MLRIIHEAQQIETPDFTGLVFADFLLEDEDYIAMGIDLRAYTGPRAKFAMGADVVYCGPEDIAHIFETEYQKPEFGMICYNWTEYCRYINQNSAA